MATDDYAESAVQLDDEMPLYIADLQNYSHLSSLGRSATFSAAFGLAGLNRI